jgi:D-alanyl-D-alanine carboxypeptidase
MNFRAVLRSPAVLISAISLLGGFAAAPALAGPTLLFDASIGLETAIPVSKLAARQPRVKVYAKPGSSITLDNAMKVMMVKSANDIAYVIAEGVGGTVENFVSMMNAEARNLGMRTSNFTNPNGWHHPDQYTSARDLGVLAMALMREFPEYSDYWNIGAVQIGRAVLTNTNGLVGRYSGVTGFKTGFVCASGFNLVATAQRGGRTLVAVVMGALSVRSAQSPPRNCSMRALAHGAAARTHCPACRVPAIPARPISAVTCASAAAAERWPMTWIRWGRSPPCCTRPG